jgi:hypothetical protein
MKSDEYRAHARECLERASEVRDSEVRRQFKEAAENWLHIADQVDRFQCPLSRRGNALNRPSRHPNLPNPAYTAAALALTKGRDTPAVSSSRATY